MWFENGGVLRILKYQMAGNCYQCSLYSKNATTNSCMT